MRVSHMSIDEFYKTPEWHRLSVKQKFFIQSYLASGNNDQVFATNCAYDMATDESARTASYHIMRQKKIQAALNRYFNKGPRELFLDQLQTDIAASKGVVGLKLRRLYAKVLAGGKLPKKRGAKS
jgi:hypothetical protein